MTAGEETSWTQYFARLQAYLQWQTDQIEALKRRVVLLETELATVKEQKGVRIDRIEYSFDQLKVERLDGTLNIGVTPGGLKSIEDFAINGQSGSLGQAGAAESGSGPFPETSMPGVAGEAAAPPPAPFAGGADTRGGATDWVQEIGRRMKDYLDGDVADDLRSWVDRHRLPLDKEAQRLVLDDIRAQLDDRVRYYAKESGNRAFVGQSIDGVAREIVERTKRDIRTALEQYMSGIQSAEEDEP
jgi:hypothetical protein